MIRLIIFDLSGVLFSLEEQPFVEQFAREHGLSPSDFYKRYIELTNQSETGRISGIKVWETVLTEFNLSGDPETLIQTMLGMKEGNKNMLELAQQLQKRHTVVFLTNYNKEYWAILKERFDFSEWFHWGFVSYELGFRKPAKECFEAILAKAGCTPHEAVFIDDSAGNLKEAEALGIREIQFISKEKLIMDLARIGVSL